MMITHSSETEKATLELIDKLYWLAELTGMSDDWVQETATEIKDQVKAKTGIDINE